MFKFEEFNLQNQSFKSSERRSTCIKTGPSPVGISNRNLIFQGDQGASGLSVVFIDLVEVSDCVFTFIGNPDYDPCSD